MRTATIGIVGGGLSGLYAAYLLEQKGISDYVLLEARNRLGGRISSTAEFQHVTSGMVENIDRIDVGPTWFWPDIQLQLDELIRHLELSRFEQFEAGDMMVERSANEPPIRMGGYVNSPPSMRLLGGMQTLTDALCQRVDRARIMTGQTVHRIQSNNDYVQLTCDDSAEQSTTWRVNQVLLAMPPRLAENRIEFIPSLPESLVRQWRATPTWMAPHSKYIATYEAPFWREQGLSGQARSARGPLTEIHDASMPGGSAALFGFFGVPAQTRSSVPQEVLKHHCRAQLTRLFGPSAATPKMEIIKDWALDGWTATAADQNGVSQHVEAPSITASSGPWRECLTGIASEWSQQFPGYVAGAIEAAEFGVNRLSERLNR